jgi:hypothetical protein
MTIRVKWAAKLSHVREVSLVGSADLLFWQNKLASENLEPADHEGRGPVMIVTAEGKFMWMCSTRFSNRISFRTNG